MSASPSPIRANRPATGPRVPVAGPPIPQAAAPLPLEEPTAPEPWWTPESLKGWAASFGLHLALLLILAFWYFVPDRNPPRAFDSRLAGSPDGVEGAEALTGGLNTPLPMPPAPMTVEETPLLSAPLAQLDMQPLLPDALARRNKAPSGGVGRPNDNQGAGDGDGFGLARFGEGGEMIRGVEVKVGDPQFTLIWDTNDVDLDLHVIEPGGKEIFWEDPKGDRGGELDVGGISKPTHWQVRVKHAGKVNVYHGKFKLLNERSKVYTLKVEKPGDDPT